MPTMTLAAIARRAEDYPNRPPSPVVTKQVADQQHKDIVALLAECDRLKAAP